MNDFFEDLYFRVMENDSHCTQASLQAAAKAEPAYRRLIELAGAEGDDLWSAIMQVGCAEAMPSFYGGLRFGLRLLAACLADETLY